MDAGTRGPRTRRRRIAANVGRALSSLAIAAVLACALCILVPAALGFDRYVITGDSMTGTIDRGSIVFEEQVPVSELDVGDVITFEPPAGGFSDEFVTHRIVAQGRHEGETFFRTKGDANASRDPDPIVLDGPTQARVEFSVPYAGYVISALSIRWVRMVVIGLPALLVALFVVRRLWRDAGEELAERRRAESAAAGPAPEG